MSVLLENASRDDIEIDTGSAISLYLLNISADFFPNCKMYSLHAQLRTVRNEIFKPPDYVNTFCVDKTKNVKLYLIKEDVFHYYLIESRFKFFFKFNTCK